MHAVPDRTEAGEYYFTYINQVPAGDIRAILRAQLPDALALFRSIDEARSMQRYAPDKWTIRQSIGHINDTERLFVFRALWFARGFDSPLPSFDQNVAVAASAADERPWSRHVEEFEHLRQSTISFFDDLPDDAWGRRGVASGNPFTVRALAFMTAGHLAHHVKILREKYLSLAV